MTSEFNIAVHALVYLNHKDTYVSSETLAKNICTNPARIRKVMGRLKKAGLITTREGVEGGYFFPRDPASVTLAQVGDALELRFISSPWQSGDVNMECLIASGMADIMEAIYDRLNGRCREALEEITLLSLDQKIFGSQQL